MATTLKLGLINIDLMLINTQNNRYSTTGTHRFSKCCKARVKNKMYCSDCGKDILNSDLLKGFDEDNILSESQSEKLKTFLDNGVIEVISIKDITETTTYDILPYIQKTQIIFPSISKGYKKSNMRSYYSFTNALKKENKYIIGKLVNRGLEHLVVIMPYKKDMLMFFLPFNHYQNTDEIDRIKEGVKNTIRIDKVDNLYGFEKEAKKFIKGFESKIDVCEIKEEKLKLINEFKNMGEVEISIDKVEVEENPFLEVN